jgi:hypothetical protein
MSYRARVNAPAEEEARDPANDPMNCPLCSGVTKRGTLSMHGGRCFRCYTAYCQAPLRWPEEPPHGAFPDGPKRWARVLHWRHQQGERLTPSQVTAYGAALRERIENAEDAFA